MKVETVKAATSRLCGCSFIHPRSPLAAGLDLVRGFGFAHVDIGVGGANAHYDPVEIAAQPQRHADVVRRETAARELVVNECFLLNFGAPLNSADADEQRRTRALFRGLCAFAAHAGFRSVLVIAGAPHEGKPREYAQDIAVRVLGELVEVAGESGLLLNLEADSESCVSRPEEARDLCERVPHLGLTLDHSHFICRGIAPERIEMLYPYTRHLHIRQSTPERIVVPVGEGTVDFADVLRKLNACGYHGLYCIEYLSLAPDDTVRREAEQQTRLMQQHINELTGNGHYL